MKKRKAPERPLAIPKMSKYKEMEQKEQYFVSRLQSKEELRSLCINLRNKYPSQANVLEVMLKVKKGLFLTELCEQAFVSQSPIQSLRSQMQSHHTVCENETFVIILQIKKKPLFLHCIQGPLLRCQ